MCDATIADPLELLTTTEMAAADRLAIAGGVAGLTLMENAGRAVADAGEDLLSDHRLDHAARRVVILCGPGNNGGDGFVAARLLHQRGHHVDVALLGATDKLTGDAAAMARRWQGPIRDPDDVDLASAHLIIDALFGAGLARPLTGRAAQLVARINASPAAVMAVDVPSGLDGTTGTVGGAVVEATATVTFFRLKPGHLLLPGRQLCGRVRVLDIAIPAGVLAQIGPRTFRNAPQLWAGVWRQRALTEHKYSRGHAVVLSGPRHATGAARLSASGALHIGAGLVTVASPEDAVGVHAAHLTAIMIAPLTCDHDIAEVLADERKNAVLLGPGAGVGQATRDRVLQALASPAAVVLDADGLSSFEGQPDTLFKAVLNRANRAEAGPVVLTPHEGEFARLFARTDADKLTRARAGARASGAIVVLKGADTVIAAPDGRAAINDNARPWLATAGTGDVLAGFVVGLLAQNVAGWEAACAGVWVHGAASGVCGPGLIAEDLPGAVKTVMHNHPAAFHDGANDDRARRP